MTHASSPALNTDDGVALVDDLELDSVGETPLKAAVDVFLPDLDVEVGLLFGEVEGVDAAVEVGVLEGLGLVWGYERRGEGLWAYASGGFVAGDHDDGADGAVLGKKTSGVAAERYFVS